VSAVKGALVHAGYACPINSSRSWAPDLLSVIKRGLMVMDLRDSMPSTHLVGGGSNEWMQCVGVDSSLCCVVLCILETLGYQMHDAKFCSSIGHISVVAAVVLSVLHCPSCSQLWGSRSLHVFVTSSIHLFHTQDVHNTG
jgi:hypothetical protein